MPRAARNRQALLDAAIRCIQENGYARTTARDLVAASRTNLGAIGYHFGSKEALMNEALAQCCRRWLDQVLSAAAEPGETGWENVVAASFGALRNDRAVAVAYLDAWAQSERAPQLRDQLAAHYTEVRTATAALVESIAAGSSGARRQLDVGALAAVLVAVFDGLMVQWLLEPDALPSIERMANALAPLLGIKSRHPEQQNA